MFTSAFARRTYIGEPDVSWIEVNCSAAAPVLPGSGGNGLAAGLGTSDSTRHCQAPALSL